MLRLAITFSVFFAIFSVAEFFFSGPDINIKHMFILSGLVTFSYYLCQILGMLSLIPFTSKTMQGRIEKKYTLISFNDAVAKELMRLQETVLQLKVSQPYYKKNGLSESFWSIYFKCNNYPESFICTWLEKPDDSPDQKKHEKYK